MNLAGPFLTINFEFDQDHGPSPGRKLDNICKVIYQKTLFGQRNGQNLG